MASPRTQPDYTSQTAAAYKTAIDDITAVTDRVAGAFAVQAQDTPDMTVRVTAGAIPAVGAGHTEVAAQNSGTIVAPSGNPRHDIVHADQATGAVGVATGAEAASPSDPSVPAGKIALARVALTTSHTEIVNADITDLRALGLFGLGGAAVEDVAAGGSGDLLRADGSGASLTGLPAPTVTVTAKTANYTALAADRGAAIVYTGGPYTLSLTAAATLGAGWWCTVANKSTGDVTIDPDGSETIDGATTLVLQPDASAMVACDGSAFHAIEQYSPRPLLHVRDEKASGTNAGTFSDGADRTRTLNTTVTNEIDGASLASDQITLPAGTYEIAARAPARGVDNHKAWLYDTTGTATLVEGSSARTDSAAATTTDSHVVGRFTLTAESDLELRHRCTASEATHGLGDPTGLSGRNEVYAEVRIWRLA